MEQVRKKSKGLVAITLVLTTMVMFVTMSFPVGAIATETAIIGGAILAFAAAAGITISATGFSGKQLAQYVYNSFENWKNRVGQSITQTQIIAQLAIEKGKLQIRNGIANLFGEYITDLENRNLVQLTAPFTAFSGGFVPVITHDEAGYQALKRYGKNYKSGDTISLSYSLSGVNHIDTFTFTLPENKVNKLGWDMVHTTTQTVGSGVTVLKRDIGDTTLNAGHALNDEMAWLCAYKSGTHYTLMLVDDFTGTMEAGYRPTTHQISGISYNMTPTNKTLVTGTVADNPIETLTSEKSVFVDVPEITDAQTVEQYTTQVNTIAATGALTATYINAERLEPLPPETDLKWITSLHSIWYYVEYAFEKAGNAFQAMGEFLEVMPQEIKYVIYGCFVLMLFGGVISKLLL